MSERTDVKLKQTTRTRHSLTTQRHEAEMLNIFAFAQQFATGGKHSALQVKLKRLLFQSHFTAPRFAKIRLDRVWLAL